MAKHFEFNGTSYFSVAEFSRELDIPYGYAQKIVEGQMTLEEVRKILEERSKQKTYEINGKILNK